MKNLKKTVVFLFGRKLTATIAVAEAREMRKQRGEKKEKKV